MAKEAYYFSHDSNARHDPKITAMRSVYGTEGYGWFWILIELMREANGYKLDMQGKYTFNAYAMQMHTDSTTAEQYIRDCINEFELFDSDETHFWSPSLLRRMEMREEVSKKRSQASLKRWGKQKNDADGMQMHSKSNPNGMQGKESKENKSKENKDIKEYRQDSIDLTNHLIEWMKRNNPNAKVPTNLDKWYDAMDKLERIDNYEYLQIRSAIDWCQQDDFWKANILSVPKLREKMNTIILQMQRKSKVISGKVTSFSKLQQLAREEEEREASGGY